MVHQVESINDAKDLSTDTYLKYFRPWFNLSFLNEEKKIEKLLKAMEHIKADIIFFQEPSPALLNELEKSGLFAIKHDPTLDTMIVVKSSSFEQVKSEE